MERRIRQEEKKEKEVTKEEDVWERGGWVDGWVLQPLYRHCKMSDGNLSLCVAVEGGGYGGEVRRRGEGEGKERVKAEKEGMQGVREKSEELTSKEVGKIERRDSNSKRCRKGERERAWERKGRRVERRQRGTN